mmetsp:Transcript_11490/g.22897  ORF Transcript_11490/g.22897 Transcript_11490/m.22897 type:complete len:316 (-) Transcript_11490:127-1074(-)
MHALEVPPRDGQVPRHGGADAEGERVEVRPELVDVDVLADVGVRHELDALGTQEVDAPVDGVLGELHVRDAVHEEAADAVLPLKDGDGMPHLVELVGGGQPGGAAPHYGDGHPRPDLRNSGGDVPLVPSLVDYGVLDVLDGDGGVHEARDARSLARGGADPARELGKVVRGVEAVDGLAELALVDEVVPLGYLVVHGAARVSGAEGRATIHAPSCLDLALHLVVLEVDVLARGVELLPVRNPLQRVPVGLGVALVVDEASELLDGLEGTVTTHHLGLIVVVVDAIAPELMFPSLGGYGVARLLRLRGEEAAQGSG